MNEKQLPVAIEHVRSQFAAWRERKRPRERIPEGLWRGAAAAAQRHGVHAVSRAVSLDPSALKRRVEALSARRGDAPGFIELEIGPPAGEGGCLLELQKGNGARMRICVQDGSSVDWARIKEAFLGA